ncbi:MAG: VCBS repeat-containing protein [Bdellovibrionaceae bacterium]|nr:VCBS repeat-containing protein [Pseudobdellovibrionaceae bacterium]
MRDSLSALLDHKYFKTISTLSLLFLTLFGFQNCTGFFAGTEFSSKKPIEEVIPFCVDITANNFNPKLTHNFNTFTMLPDYNQVMSSPVVGDLNGDGYPEIGFVTFNKNGAYAAEGVLRIIDGYSKREYLTIGGANSPNAPFASISPLFIDIDGNGLGEIVYVSADRKSIIAIHHNGLSRWRHELTDPYVCYSGLAAADLNGDGKAEIIAQNEVLFENKRANNKLGVTSLTYKSTKGGCSHFASNLSNNDKGLPIISSQGVYEFQDGRFVERFAVKDIKCGGNCHVSVANLNPNYPGKELVFTGSEAFRIYSSSGQILADKNLTEHYPDDSCGTKGVGGGVATIGNFDSDPNTTEIAIATGKSLTIFDWRGNKIAGSRTNDCSSLVTGVTSFDFNGDGIPEILYGDEDFFRVYAITPGNSNLKVIWEIVNTSGTLHEYPVVADLNRDWSPEIIVVSNNYASKHQAEGTNGLRIFSAAEGEGVWMPTREVWNQHNYFISNVTDKLRATSFTGHSDEVSKNFRRNLPGDDIKCKP